MGFYWDNGKENGNYYLGLRVWGFRVRVYVGFGVSGLGLGFRAYWWSLALLDTVDTKDPA